MILTRHVPLFPLLLLLVANPAADLTAQSASPDNVVGGRGGWRATAEVGGVFGGTWLDGVSAPKVRTDAGATIGIGLKRRVRDRYTTGAAVTVGAQAISIAEGGARWSGGTLTEASLQGVLSILASQGTPLRPSLDLSMGAVVLSGADQILPFRGVSRFAAIGEVGVTARRVEHRVDRQEFAVFVRYGTVRRTGTATEPPITSASAASANEGAGWVGRWRAGLQVTR